MSSAKQIVKLVLQLPEPERSALAIALLDLLNGPDPEGELTSEAFLEEMAQRAEQALTSPTLGGDWRSLRQELL